MTTDANQPGNDQDVISGYYENYKETQAYIFATDSKKVRNTLIWIGAILFVGDFLALALTDLISGETILYASVFPVIYILFAFLALKQPRLAIILGFLVFAAIIGITFWAYGSRSLIKGALAKAIILYLLFAGLQSAKTAEQAKRELNS